MSDEDSVLGNIEHSDPLADAAENAITALEQASKHQLSAVALDVRVSLRRALDQHRGAVDENRRLWARDHARGHRATSDCHVCVKFADAPALAGGR